MSPDQRTRWIENFEPSLYLPGITCPILFVNGTNDFAYPLDSYRKSYRAVSARRELCVTVRMPHSHPAGWQPVEIGLFVDSVLRDGVPLAQLAAPHVEADRLIATVRSPVLIKTAQLHYTTDLGPWQERVWHSREATVSAGQVSAQLPAQRPVVAMLTVTDARDATVSTEHLEWDP
jgi:hypothetical protein